MSNKKINGSLGDGRCYNKKSVRERVGEMIAGGGLTFLGNTRGDGNCLFNAVLDLMKYRGEFPLPNVLGLRYTCYEWLRNHVNTPWRGTTVGSFFMTNQEMLGNILLDRVPVGNYAVFALSNVLKRKIHVYYTNPAFSNLRFHSHSPIDIGKKLNEPLRLFLYQSRGCVGHFQALVVQKIVNMKMK